MIQDVFFSYLLLVNILALIILIGGNLLFFMTLWLCSKYDHIYLDQIIFQLKAPAVGASKSLAGSAVVSVGVFAVALTGVEIFLYLFLAGYFEKLKEKSKRYCKYCLSKSCAFFKKTAFPVALSTLLVACTLFIAKLEVVDYE